MKTNCKIRCFQTSFDHCPFLFDVHLRCQNIQKSLLNQPFFCFSHGSWGVQNHSLLSSHRSIPPILPLCGRRMPLLRGFKKTRFHRMPWQTSSGPLKVRRSALSVWRCALHAVLAVSVCRDRQYTAQRSVFQESWLDTGHRSTRWDRGRTLFERWMDVGLRLKHRPLLNRIYPTQRCHWSNDVWSPG